MTAAHTPGPLVNKGHGVISGGPEVERSNGSVQQQVAMVTHLENGDRDENARRLIAAWNACDGISTEALEAGAVGALLECLKQLMDDPEISEREDSEDRVFARARAAIAKAAGEQP